jgi:beta-1,4-glucosyltransferase
MKRQEVTLVNDGLGVSLASYLLYGKDFPENLNGTDLVPRLISELDGSTRLYLLGSRREVVQKAARLWESDQNVTVAGCQDGYSVCLDDINIISKINKSEANVLLVALGNPRQEQWILRNASHLAPTLIIGVGALFDFMSGSMPRAPTLMRRLRLEWLFRLSKEPGRLIGRYTLGSASFAVQCANQWWSGLQPRNHNAGKRSCARLTGLRVSVLRGVHGGPADDEEDE